jgi:hypothetical protein
LAAQQLAAASPLQTKNFSFAVKPPVSGGFSLEKTKRIAPVHIALL